MVCHRMHVSDDILIVRMCTVCITLGKVKQSLYQPGLALSLPEGEAPRFKDIWHMRVVRLSALNTCPFYPLENIFGAHFC